MMCHKDVLIPPHFEQSQWRCDSALIAFLKRIPDFHI